MHRSSTRRAAGTARILMALAVLAAGVVIAPPAEAKVPSRTPEATLKCKNGKKAKIWWQGTKDVERVDDEFDRIWWDLSQFAVNNPCKDWLYFDIRTVAESESDCCHGVQVAPGAIFTKTKKDVPSVGRLFNGYGETPFSVREAKKDCVDPNGAHNQVLWDVAKDGKATTTQDCPRKYPESDSRIISCPESWNPKYGRYDERAEGVWKLDGKKIIKLAARNYCEFEMIFWWKTPDGRRISLWVDEVNPYSSANSNIFDLWKDELDPLPRKTKDGVVHFIEGPRMGPTTEDTAAYDENWRVYEGKPYKWEW